MKNGIQDLIGRLELDYLFIDTHPGLNEETLLSIVLSDALIVLLRPDKQDYQGTAVTVDIARELEVPRLYLVLNKVPSSVDPETVRTQVAATYDAPVLGVLQLTEDMAVLGSAGLMTLREPDHPYSVTVRAVAQQLMAG
jgi:MinD-like ATPase involved in chromosome partitioning or flagellar assembly